MKNTTDKNQVWLTLDEAVKLVSMYSNEEPSKKQVRQTLKLIRLQTNKTLGK